MGQRKARGLDAETEARRVAVERLARWRSSGQRSNTRRSDNKQKWDFLDL
jgi:hypothetical protein